VRKRPEGRSGDTAPSSSKPVESVWGMGLPVVVTAASQYSRAPWPGGRASAAPGRRKRAMSGTDEGDTGSPDRSRVNLRPVASAATKSVRTGHPGTTAPKSCCCCGGGGGGCGCWAGWAIPGGGGAPAKVGGRLMRIELLAPAAQWYMAGAVGSNPPPWRRAGVGP